MDISNSIKESHPAYGAIQISRVNGGNGQFFGSALNPSNYIEIRIYEASMNMNLTDNYVYPNKLLTSIKLTNSQFAEAITSLNNGSGTPCTLQFADGKQIPQDLPSFYQKMKDNDKTLIKDGLRKDINALKESTDKITEIFNSKRTFSKKDQSEILGILNLIRRDLDGSLDFYADCYAEKMDKVSSDSKTEIEAYIDGAIRRAGIRNLNLSDDNFLKIEK